jgi:thiol-disulfide isomerase/thioredoxin
MSTFSDAYFDAGFFAACVCVLLVLVIAVGRVPGLSKSPLIARRIFAAVLIVLAVVALVLDAGAPSLSVITSKANAGKASTRRVQRQDTMRRSVVSLGDTGETALQRVAAQSESAPSHLLLGEEGKLPSLAGASFWFNSGPLTPQSLRGKVVLVNVWTYSCINSLRPMPYLRAWAEKYRAAGLVVIGVHSPEFSFEKVPANVQRAVKDLHIDFPIAGDSDFAIWRAFDNEYWPAFYFIDAQGRIRHHRFGEGQYDKAERVIQQLLAEAGSTDIPTGLVAPQGHGIEAAPDLTAAQSQETYLGYARADGFSSAGGAVRDSAHAYQTANLRRIDQWALTGEWSVERERAVSVHANGRIAYRFHARDLNLVMGPTDDARPARFRVTVDGKAPLADHGSDTDADGNGTIDGHRLYQLVRQATISDKDHLFEIEFVDPGAQVYVFTFG